jgi:hypothetical protein
MLTSGRSDFRPWSRAASVTNRTAVYGSVRTVVWQGSAGDRCPYADQTRQCLLILVAGRLHYGRVVAISDKWLLLPKRAFAATEIL